jgi:hypothetical protein
MLQALGVACSPDAAAVIKRLKQLRDPLHQSLATTAACRKLLADVSRLYSRLADCAATDRAVAFNITEAFGNEPLVYVPPAKYVQQS